MRDTWPNVLQALKRGAWPFYLWGDVGTGKSYLAAQSYCVFKGSAKFVRFCDLIGDAIALEREPEIHRWCNGRMNEITKVSFWRVIETTGLLVIDEIGTGIVNEWRNELFWRVLEVRVNKPLIMTGNIKPPDLITQFDRRIRSRFYKGQLYEVTGRDQRNDGIRERIHRG